MFIYRAYSIYKSVKMAASTKEDEITFHRKVQQRLADRYLDAIDKSKKDEESKQMKQRQGSINYSGNQPKSNQRFSLPNILWLIASIGVFRFTEFYLVILYDPRIDRIWFNIGASLITLTLIIAVFLIVWVSMVKKINSDLWEKRYPTAIPTATASFILGALCVIKGLWPVWGLLTPFILGTVFMGIVILITMFG